MSVSLQEQETVINMSRDLDYADIYTSDRTVMTRLDKLAEDENCPDWSCTGVQYDQNGELVAKTYRTKKSLVSYRSSTPKREYTEEQMEERRVRMRHMQEVAKQKREEKKNNKEVN